MASDTRLMVPVKGAERILRPVSSPSTVEEALAVIEQPSSHVAGKGSTWQQSQQQLEASLRTGQLRGVAEVIHRLMGRSRRKSLSFTQRRTMRRATTFLASELALVKGISLEQAEYQVGTLAS